MGIKTFSCTLAASNNNGATATEFNLMADLDSSNRTLPHLNHCKRRQMSPAINTVTIHIIVVFSMII